MHAIGRLRDEELQAVLEPVMEFVGSEGSMRGWKDVERTRVM